MSTDVTDETTAPEVDPWDAAFDEMESEQPVEDGQPRDEQGRFASRGEEEEVSTPEETVPDATVPDVVPTETTEEPVAEEAPPWWKFRAKVDHEEQDVDLETLAKEHGPQRLREFYEKGYGFDRAVARTKQESFQEGQNATIRWLDSQGFRVRQNPAVQGGWEIVPKQGAMPANGAAPGATPEVDPAVRRAELERIAVYGDGKPEGESDPAAQINAIRELARLDAMEAAQKQYAPIQQWRDQLAQQAQQRQAAEERARAEQAVASQIKGAIEARAKSFEGPGRERLVERVHALAMAKARTDAKDMGEVLSIVTNFANDLDAQREFYAKQGAMPAVKKSAEPPKPTPSLDGTPTSGAPDLDFKKNPLKGWDDPRIGAAIDG